MDESASLPPRLLLRVPDARRASLPLFDAALFPYAGLMVSGLGAGVLAAYNAASVRRYGIAGASLLIGVACWTAALVLLNAIDPQSHVHLWVLGARGLGIASGLVLMRAQAPLVRGHEHLDGKTLPLVGSVLVIFFLAMFILPSPIVVALFGLISVPL